MGYPENVLAADERVVLHRHPHWKRLIRPVLVLLVVTALAAFGARGGQQLHIGTSAVATNVVMAVIGVVWLIVIGWLVLWPFLNWRSTHFVITDRRVMFRHGLLTRSGIDIPLARINSVEFRHGLLGPDGAHRHPDHRVREPRSSRVPRHSARRAGALTAVSRSLRHPGFRGIAELSLPVRRAGAAMA